MNDSKLRKGTKYVTLKDEDIHTITGALKQFFRELKTDLIPDELVRHLPNDLGNRIGFFCVSFDWKGNRIFHLIEYNNLEIIFPRIFRSIFTVFFFSFQ